MATRMKEKARDRVKDKAREKEKPREGEARPSRFAGIQRFIRDTRSELRKVVWPTRETAINLTVIVTIVSVVVGLFLGGMDLVFERIMEMLIGS